MKSAPARMENSTVDPQSVAPNSGRGILPGAKTQPPSKWVEGGSTGLGLCSGWDTSEISGTAVVAGSVVLAMMVVMIVVGPTAGAWLPLMRFAQNGTINGCVEPSPVGSLFRSSGPLPLFQNFTGKIVEELARNGTGDCYEHHTKSTRVIGLPDNVEVLTLFTNVVHKFWLQSYNAAGERRCAGGDYYELDLSSSLWKSRPPIQDLQNGTYAVQFMVPDAYAGSFNFAATLLFDAYHGLDLNGTAFKIWESTVFFRINFVTSDSVDANARLLANASTAQQPKMDADNLLTLKRCDPTTDFKAHEWSGRWSRPVDNGSSCTPDDRGRYAHCFPYSDIPCRNPSWCSGNVSRLESLGWSYSAHCTFHIFEPQEAWDCLDGRWLFFWGDSNHLDTIRNLLTFILQVQPAPGRDILHIDRAFQSWFRNPSNLAQEVRITNLFNGHPMVDHNGLGLDSLAYPQYREYVSDFFKAKRYPDAVIMNSGLHDGAHHQGLSTYLTSVENALGFWSNVFDNVTGEPPQLIYRTTIPPAGWYRSMPGNPQKMEVYNRIMAEMVQMRFPSVQLVDAFDMSFPFHFDNSHSDGGHYGRPPQRDWPHFIFVDLMLGHALLNALCPPVIGRV